MARHERLRRNLPEGRTIQFGGEEPSRPDDRLGNRHYETEFRMEHCLPIWCYEIDGSRSLSRDHRDYKAGARHFLDGFPPHLDEAAIGSVSEIFDAEPPFTPRGCIAQAWGVAEGLRCWVKTADDLALNCNRDVERVLFADPLLAR